MRGAEFAELKAFLAVASEASFRRAAVRLGVSPSALSHTIKALEKRIGAQLLHRTTRSMALTQAGQALFSRIQPAMAEVENAVKEVGAYQTEPKGLIRLNLPRIAARLVVSPALPGFLRRYPKVRFDLVIDDTMADVVADGFDAGIRSGELVHKDMVAVRIAPDLKMVVVGSPTYFQVWPAPHSPWELHDHACLSYRWNETGSLYRWMFESQEGAVEIRVQSTITCNDTDTILASALQGIGLAFLPQSYVEKHLEAGALIKVLDAWTKPFSGFHLYYAQKPYMPSALRAFVDYMKWSAPPPA